MEEWEHGREFLVATINQCLNNKSSNEIIQIAKTIFDNVKTNLSIQYILSYLVYAYQFNTENLVMEQLPGESVFINGVWVFNHNPEETNKMIDKILENFNKK